MHKSNFEDAVERIAREDARYSRGGYAFLREALDFTLRTRAARAESRTAGSLAAGGHVSGQQLLDGFRRYALENFGPMAITVLEEWGIRSTNDVGEMVFNLIESEVFGKTDSDSKADFADLCEFHAAFVEPFLPKRGERPDQADDQ